MEKRTFNWAAETTEGKIGVDSEVLTRVSNEIFSIFEDASDPDTPRVKNSELLEKIYNVFFDQGDNGLVIAVCVMLRLVDRFLTAMTKLTKQYGEKHYERDKV